MCQHALVRHSVKQGVIYHVIVLLLCTSFNKIRLPFCSVQDWNTTSQRTNHIKQKMECQSKKS